MNEKERREAGRRIAQLRARRGWSLVKLADLSGVSENTVIGAESGETKTHESNLRKIFAALESENVPDMLDIGDVPEPGRIFLEAVTQRLKVIEDETELLRRITAAYPTLLGEDPVD